MTRQRRACAAKPARCAVSVVLPVPFAHEATVMTLIVSGRPALPGARGGMRRVDRRDRALDRRPQAGDLGGGGGVRLVLADALAGGERQRQARTLADLARPDRDLMLVEERPR